MVREHISLCGLVFMVSGAVGPSAASGEGGVNLRFSLGKKTDEKPVTIAVSGKITDAKTGEPIPDALVRGHAVVYRTMGPELFDKSGYLEVHSDKDGAYELKFVTLLTTAGPMKGKDYVCLDVSARGYETRPRYLRPRLSPEKTSYPNTDFKLAQGRQVTGRIVDDKGKSVEGALVKVGGSGNGNWEHYGSLGKTHTNKNGEFEIWCSKDTKGVMPRDPYIRISKRGHGAAIYYDLFKKEGTGDLLLPAGGTIAGRVVDTSGKGVAGCEVCVAYKYRYAVFDRTKTDAQGKYTFSGLPGANLYEPVLKRRKAKRNPDAFKAVVYARHVPQMSLRDVPQYEILVKEGKTVEAAGLVIGAPASVSGKLIPSTSTYGTEGLMVRLDHGWDQMVEADAGGRFHFPYVRSGKHKLTAYLPNNLRGDRGIGHTEIDVKPGESLTDVRIQLETLAEVRAQFVDADGNPLKGITAGATWTRTGHGFWTEGTVSEADGRAVLWLYPGQVQYVRGFDHSQRSLVAENVEPVKPKAGQVVNSIRIVMLPTASLRGRLLTDAKTPLAEKRAICKLKFSGKNEDQKYLMTDAAGRFEFKRLVPGVIRLEIETSPLEYQARTTEPIEVKPGEHKDIGDIVLEPVRFYKISGKLVASPTFDDLAGFKIRAGLQSWKPLVTTDAEGRFVVTKARAGRNRLTAYLPFNLRTDRGVGHTYVTVKDRDVAGVELKLETLTRIPVRITDESGKPLEGISAAAWWTENHSGVFTEGTKSDKQGRATLYLYPASRQYLGAHDWSGRYTLKAHKEITPVPGNIEKEHHVVMTTSKSAKR